MVVTSQGLCSLFPRMTDSSALKNGHVFLNCCSLSIEGKNLHAEDQKTLWRSEQKQHTLSHLVCLVGSLSEGSKLGMHLSGVTFSALPKMTALPDCSVPKTNVCHWTSQDCLSASFDFLDFMF